MICRCLCFSLKDPDSEVVSFAKRTVKDLKLPPTFMTQIAQSIQVSGSFGHISLISNHLLHFSLIFVDIEKTDVLSFTGAFEFEQLMALRLT